MKKGIFTSLGKIILTALAASVFSHQSQAQTFTSNSTGTHDGYYYSFWTEGGGQASMTLGPKGNYSTKWTNIQNFTAGKGWRTGTRDRIVCFEGTYDGGSNGFLAVYGWTKDPLIEYYVVESHGQWDPPGNTSDIQNLGSFTSDGGTYDVYRSQRVNKPSIIGNATFYQFWSVRRTKRSSGTVTFENHVKQWESSGLKLGTTWDYQIMESEGYGSSGSSNITVLTCNTCAAPAPTVTASVSYEVGATASQLTASGTSLKWYTVASGGTASTTAPTPSTATAGVTTYYVSQTANGCESERAAIKVTVAEIFKIYKTPNPITIDGEIEANWNAANVIGAKCAKVLTGTVSNTADLSGTFKALWDNTYLYILADVTDDTQKNDSQNAYDDDAVEVYIDINNDKETTYGANDVQYTFGWNDGTTVGSLPSGRATTNITYKVVNKTGGYLVEARIPWSTVSGSPALNQMLGIDFMINDDDDGSTRDAKISYNSATDDAWQDASLFGVAQLKDVITASEEAELLSGISVYPNPVHDQLSITIPSLQAEVSLYSAGGLKLYHETVGGNQAKIDMTGFKSGVYMLQIVTEGQTITKKVVRQ